MLNHATDTGKVVIIYVEEKGQTYNKAADLTSIQSTTHGPEDYEVVPNLPVLRKLSSDSSKGKATKAGKPKFVLHHDSTVRYKLNGLKALDLGKAFTPSGDTSKKNVKLNEDFPLSASGYFVFPNDQWKQLTSQVIQQPHTAKPSSLFR